jgi:hypothetical protein
MVLLLATYLAQAPFAPAAEIVLTPDNIGRLLKILPKLKHVQPGAVPVIDASTEQEIVTILSAQGLDALQFTLQMSALMATYLSLRPQTLAESLPAPDSPQAKSLIDKAPPEARAAMRQQIAFAHQNKAMLQQQFDRLATDQNKRALQPYLGQLDQLFKDVHR